MTSDIKNTAIPAAGYVYQTMQGVNLLCDWLDSPTRYTRIRFECDEDAVAPQGLDDLVAERPDGRFDLWQVKFTPSPDKHALDWEWLLDKPGKAGGRSRSNLRKWFDAFMAIEGSRVGEIRLVTNRVPDLLMEACLAGNFIDYKCAPDEVRIKIEQELNGADNAERLFKVLEVRHSDKGFTSIEAHVTQRLRRYATVEGTETLKNRAVHWSIEKNRPAPDGWITFDLLKATLKVVAPEPLPENFAIPPGYRVPDNAFYLSFIAAIESTPKQPMVLTGPPGRGKSTFLSKVCELLQKKGIPFARHHYYLSQTDRSLDRHTSFVVEESFLSQVDNFHSGVVVHDRTLRAALATCAAYYKSKGKPFVVVLDGLDHVWRNQGHDKRPLDEVFNQVLPAVENLVIVVGTQPVEDVQLPNRLLTEAPRSTWRELPPMSGDAVLQYLRKELSQGRLQMDIKGARAEQELQAAAAEMRVRTNGHPLHVIYATEELVRSGRLLSKWSVEQLAGDLSHDVKSYYGSLWQLLAASQKDVLRLICEFPFFWPKSAFVDIPRLAGLPVPAVTSVEHLLHHSAAGLKAFHESLVVFVKQTDEYEQRIAALTPHVEAWLNQTAPNALRVNWLWAVKAKQGRPEELIAGLQRDWVMERLQEGYPTELFEGLLGEAEEHAIQRARYADAYRLRHLKTRLLNSLSYQLSGADAARLKACTWTLAPDVSVIEEAVASRHEMSTVDMAALSISLYARGDSPTAARCAEEALRRYRGESRFVSGIRSYEARDRMLYLAKAFSTLGVVGTSLGWAVEIVSESSPSTARKFLEAHVEQTNLRMLVNIAVAVPEGKVKLMVCDAAVRAAAMAEADLTAWNEFQHLNCGVLISCLAALAGNDMGLWMRPLEVDWLSHDYEGRRESLARLAYDWFFGAARLALTTKYDDFCMLNAPQFKERENVSDYLNRLGDAARDVARRWAAREAVSFSYIYEAFDNIAVPDFRNYERGQGAADFRRALHTIATDLHLLSSRLGSSPQVDASELQRAMNLSWFDGAQFRTQYVSGGAKALSDEAADLFIRNQLTALDESVNEETGVRMMAVLELCEMALRHNLNSLAADLCRRTWELALGYGQRKDPALSDVMNALEYLQPIAPDETRRLLADIAPQVHHVLTYTDGKGTRHVLAQADELLAKLNRSALTEKHKEHMEVGDWYHAENSLKTYVATGDSSSPVLKAVVRTGLHADAVDSLKKAAADGDSGAARMLAEAQTHMGADVGQITESRPGNSAEDWRKPFTGDVKTYAVDDLLRLLTDLREHYGVRRDILREWYAHWEAQGNGSKLIAVLEPKLLSEDCRDDDLAKLLDLAFATKLRLEGAAAAFPYIVQAQLFNGGWLGSMSERREVTEVRLRLVVDKYRRRCDEFFLKSAFSWYSAPRRTRVIPSDMMVFFLGLQRRTAEAVQFAEAMVRSVQEDTRTLRLERPNWANILGEEKGGAA
ncbi:ATP-binding protein [Burkholderia vietnamiensis]|uniref:ATP-binding protein n=1 Tax=Burkholderia vietnamiensis TaxID=60552 RepID=UPI001593A61F|nr:NACHT domain-containing protein [Burkholderia vietnamiensis]MCA7942775.1 NACHT domain-containing protein [Burkholderia vietnamiensis]HDR8974580.1 NACHT domain-containing protein [Burkholderia vietnamiensis]HDR9222128.1 NACHT domain-containing protein [Burkholderia vietnamiensis]